MFIKPYKEGNRITAIKTNMTIGFVNEARISLLNISKIFSLVFRLKSSISLIDTIATPQIINEFMFKHGLNN